MLTWLWTLHLVWWLSLMLWNHQITFPSLQTIFIVYTMLYDVAWPGSRQVNNVADDNKDGTKTKYYRSIRNWIPGLFAAFFSGWLSIPSLIHCMWLSSVGAAAELRIKQLMQRKRLCELTLHVTRVHAVFVIPAWLGRRTLCSCKHLCVHIEAGQCLYVLCWHGCQPLKRFACCVFVILACRLYIVNKHIHFNYATSRKQTFLLSHIYSTFASVFVSIHILMPLYFISQLQEIGIEMASRQEPRKQGWSRETVQGAVRSIWSTLWW